MTPKKDDYMRGYADAFKEVAAELTKLREYAHEATKTITDLVGGGSECFAGRIGEMYIADLPYCKRRIRDRENNTHQQLLTIVREKRKAVQP